VEDRLRREAPQANAQLKSSAQTCPGVPWISGKVLKPIWKNILFLTIAASNSRRSALIRGKTLLF